MLVDWNISGHRRALRGVARGGGFSVNQSPRRKGPREITLVGTVERDPQFYPNKSGVGEHGVVRVRAVTPGYTFTRNGQETVVADKTQWHSATVYGAAAVEKLRNFRAGDEIALPGAMVDPYRSPETGRPVLGIRAFDVSNEITDAQRKEPNQVHVAGSISEVAFRANRGNQQLDYFEYKVMPFGKDAQPILIREFGETARNLEAARAVGEKVEIDGRLTHGSFEGRNGRIDTYYTPKEVENLRERAAERSQERDRERAAEIDRDLGVLFEDGLSLERDGLKDTAQYAEIRERYDALAEERKWLTMTPAERAAGYEQAAAERDAAQPTIADAVPQSELDAVAALNEEHRQEAIETIDLSALPVVSAGGTVRDAAEIPHDFNARVRGRDESGEHVIASLGGRPVAIERGAFSERPEVGEVVEVSRDDGGVHALTERQAELAAEYEFDRGEEIEVG